MKDHREEGNEEKKEQEQKEPDAFSRSDKRTKLGYDA